MHLGDRSGGWLELQVAGYQFPELEPGCEPQDSASWDCNWLVIHGSVGTATGAAWEFRDPALTTWEVGELVAWLRQVADDAVPAASPVGEVDASPVDGDVDDIDQLIGAGWLTFTEPNLSFAVAAYARSQVELLIGLSHGFARPLIDAGEPKRCEITAATTRHELRRAADELQEQLVAHPVR